MVWLLGALSAAAENVTLWPGVSKLPLLSRSHAYVSGPPSGSLAEAETTTEAPSPTWYGPPASTVGGVVVISGSTGEEAGKVLAPNPPTSPPLNLIASQSLKPVNRRSGPPLAVRSVLLVLSPFASKAMTPVVA